MLSKLAGRLFASRDDTSGHNPVSGPPGGPSRSPRQCGIPRRTKSSGLASLLGCDEKIAT